MQQNNFDDDALWDDGLDESDFEQCILKETEFLTQNPSFQRKTSKSSLPTIDEPSKQNHWVDGSSNSFTNNLKSLSKSVAKNGSSERQYGKGKTSSNPFLRGNSFSPTSKKQSFYKPLDVGPSSGFSNMGIKPTPITTTKSDTTQNVSDVKSLQKQLDSVLKEKAKLEEENLVKQGEVSNIRCELKRKDAAFEAQRIDHCLALENAEKKGKEKSSKMLTDAELKVKTLEKEVDRLQSNLIFKSREVEELLSRCKRFEGHEGQSSFLCTQDTFMAGEGSSSKKRRLDTRGSPSKTASNFANRFDFGDTRKSIKNAQTQTVLEIKAKTRTTIRVPSSRGISNGSQKVYHHLSSSRQVMDHVSSSENDSVEWGLFLLARLISTEKNSHVISTDSREEIVKAAHSLLQRLLEELNKEGSSSDKRSKSLDGRGLSRKEGIGWAIPPLSIVAVAQPTSEKTVQDSLRIVALCLQAFVRINADPTTELLVILESLAVLARECSDLYPDTCDAIMTSFNEYCNKASSDQITMKFLVSLLFFVKFEAFKQRLCKKSGECSLKKICSLFGCTGKSLRTKEITNLMVAFAASLLHNTDLLTTRRKCNCSSLIFSSLINHLLHTTDHLSEDARWYPVLSGVKVLHLWLCKDRTYWEKAAQLNSYPALLSLLVRKSKYLKAKGILDQPTWELFFDLYDVEEPAIS